MTGPGLAHKPLGLLLAALVCAAGAWLYAQRVLVRYQIADAAAHERPRGNLSDLYPRWFGARELLLHGRDPYGPDVTREIQQGYYGRPLDPTRTYDPKDQQGFAYPIYVIFCLAPTVHLPFALIQKWFFWILLGAVIITVPLWLRMLHWSLPPPAALAMVALTLGSLPVVEGLKLQQLTLIVAPLLAISVMLLVSDWPVAAGILLAVSTIKPQLVWLLLLWLMIWTFADWRRRYRWAVSFLLTMMMMIAASEWYLPHWIPRFLGAVRQYRDYTDTASVLDTLVAPLWASLLWILIAATALCVCWKNRRFTGDSRGFITTTALVFAVTIVLIPSHSLYNQVMLFPALLLLTQDRHRFWARNALSRVLFTLTALCLFWPWLAATLLATLSFVLPASVVERAWAVPFWTALPLPVGVAALVLVAHFPKAFAARGEPGAS